MGACTIISPPSRRPAHSHLRCGRQRGQLVLERGNGLLERADGSDLAALRCVERLGAARSQLGCARYILRMHSLRILIPLLGLAACWQKPTEEERVRSRLIVSFRWRLAWTLVCLLHLRGAIACARPQALSLVLTQHRLVD